ncbi:hypothetical protein FOL47_008512 [Perkinsus chesapeaki]|uniref:Uncharacterized protein n=1 Tax=Perkinsus chesapeaki TaxID=330153 RepID=A0A7J6MTL9_PERCH|nr:hypothetical protein FOL47_008512 [Perkinsus chesapeaki]
MASPGGSGSVSVMSTDEKMEKLANKYLRLRAQYGDTGVMVREMALPPRSSADTSLSESTTGPEDDTYLKERIAELEQKLKSYETKSSPGTSVLGFGAMKGLLGPATGGLPGGSSGESRRRVEELEATVEELHTRIEVINRDCKRLQEELSSVSLDRDGLTAKYEEICREREGEAALMRK